MAMGVDPVLEDAFGRKISLDLRDMDIVDVLKFLSMKRSCKTSHDGTVCTA